MKRMRKSVIIFAALFAFVACTENSGNTQNEKDTTEANLSKSVGGDKDEHGCLVAAGESWSQIKQNCVQIFEVAQRLNPINKDTAGAEFSAFILFNDDNSEAEVFLPGNKSVLLKSKGNGIYDDESHKFDAKDSTLYVNGNAAYKSSGNK